MWQIPTLFTLLLALFSISGLAGDDEEKGPSIDPNGLEREGGDHGPSIDPDG